MKIKDIIQNEDKKHSLKDLKKIKSLLKVYASAPYRSSKQWFIGKQLEMEFNIPFDDWQFESSLAIAGARGEEN
jgi:hypothetical protein